MFSSVNFTENLPLWNKKYYDFNLCMSTITIFHCKAGFFGKLLTIWARTPKKRQPLSFTQNFSLSSDAAASLHLLFLSYFKSSLFFCARFAWRLYEVAKMSKVLHLQWFSSRHKGVISNIPRKGKLRKKSTYRNAMIAKAICLEMKHGKQYLVHVIKW